MTHRFVCSTILALGLAALAAPAQAADLKVSFADPAWDGRKIPSGQHCSKFGGHGATPPLRVEGIPAEANAIIVEYNDRSFRKLSYDGGHGKIGHDIPPGVGVVVLSAVPGETSSGLPDGTWIHKRNRATGSYARPGYLPPCSGGRGNSYFAEVFAVRKSGDDMEELAEGKLNLGTY